MRHHPRSRCVFTRRQSFARAAASAWVAAGLGLARPVGAAALAPTPRQSEGPYYPVDKSRPARNDLLHGVTGIAEGVPLELTGRVLSVDGAPVVAATVEIWQCDNRGIYRHPRAPRQGREDPNFRGYGEVAVDGSGAYAFLTIVPVAYPGRPPHIHAKVKSAGTELTTQLYLLGHPGNQHVPDELLFEPRPATLSDGMTGRVARFDFVV